jgi:hypothetical protein
MTNPAPPVCLNCHRLESEVPLVVLQFRQKTSHICPQCLPVLIHHPETFQAKIDSLA